MIRDQSVLSRPVYDFRLWYSRVSTDKALDEALRWMEGVPIHSCVLFNADFNFDPPFMSLETHQKRADRLTQVVRRLLKADYLPAINVLHTTGHGNKKMDLRGEFGFQPVVGADGQEVGGAVCTMDPVLHDHVAKLYRIYAQTGARHIWVDDDLRISHKMQKSDYCFCPLHLRELSARTSRAWDLPSLLDALRRESEDVYREWNAVSADATASILARIEAAVHGVDPGIRIGLMTCGCSTSRSLDAELAALRGAGSEPLLRPGGGYWWDENILGALRKRMQIRSEQPFSEGACESSYEMENYPYWPSLKSHSAIRVELDLNILDGTDRIMLNIFDAVGPLDPEGRLKNLLRGRHGFLSALRKSLQGTHAVGVGVARSTDYARNKEFGKWSEGLARLGVPTVSGTDAVPAVLCGRSCDSLDDAAIAAILRNGAILDWGAVSACARRKLPGFADLEITSRAVNLRDIAYERHTDSRFNGPLAGRVSEQKLDAPLVWNYLRTLESSLGSGDDRQVFYATADGVKTLALKHRANGKLAILSEWVDKNGRSLSPSLMLYAGDPPSLVFPFDVGESAFLNGAKAFQISSFLSQVEGYEGVWVKEVNSSPVVYRAPGSVIIGIARFSLDPVDEPRVWLSSRLGTPKGGVLVLTNDGQWEPCGHEFGRDDVLGSGGCMVLKKRIEPMSVSVFQWAI